MWWWLVMFVTLASMRIASQMAFARGRSGRQWIWIAAAVGPFALVAIYLLGTRKERPAPA
jgi:hypothetical protein